MWTIINMICNLILVLSFRNVMKLRFQFINSWFDELPRNIFSSNVLKFVGDTLQFLLNCFGIFGIKTQHHRGF